MCVYAVAGLAASLKIMQNLFINLIRGGGSVMAWNKHPWAKISLMCVIFPLRVADGHAVLADKCFGFLYDFVQVLRARDFYQTQ